MLAGGSLWVLPLLRPTPYDPIKDFAPISLLEVSVNVVSVHPSVSATSIGELIALAKGKPGELNYATSGIGSTPHLATELFKSMTGVNMVHVPYKGSGPALTALLGAQVQVYFVSAPAAAPHLKAGRLRGLAVTSPAAVRFSAGLAHGCGHRAGVRSSGHQRFVGAGQDTHGDDPKAERARRALPAQPRSQRSVS